MKKIDTIIKMIFFPVFFVMLLVTSIISVIFEQLMGMKEDKHTFVEMINWYFKEL